MPVLRKALFVALAAVGVALAAFAFFVGTSPGRRLALCPVVESVRAPFLKGEGVAEKLAFTALQRSPSLPEPHARWTFRNVRDDLVIPLPPGDWIGPETSNEPTGSILALSNGPTQQVMVMALPEIKALIKNDLLAAFADTLASRLGGWHGAAAKAFRRDLSLACDGAQTPARMAENIVLLGLKSLVPDQIVRARVSEDGRSVAALLDVGEKGYAAVRILSVNAKDYLYAFVSADRALAETALAQSALMTRMELETTETEDDRIVKMLEEKRYEEYALLLAESCAAGNCRDVTGTLNADEFQDEVIAQAIINACIAHQTDACTIAWANLETEKSISSRSAFVSAVCAEASMADNLAACAEEQIFALKGGHVAAFDALVAKQIAADPNWDFQYLVQVAEESPDVVAPLRRSIERHCEEIGTHAACSYLMVVSDSSALNARWLKSGCASGVEEYCETIADEILFDETRPRPKRIAELRELCAAPHPAACTDLVSLLIEDGKDAEARPLIEKGCPGRDHNGVGTCEHLMAIASEAKDEATLARIEEALCPVERGEYFGCNAVRHHFELAGDKNRALRAEERGCLGGVTMQCFPVWSAIRKNAYIASPEYLAHVAGSEAELTTRSYLGSQRVVTFAAPLEKSAAVVTLIEVLMTEPTVRVLLQGFDESGEASLKHAKAVEAHLLSQGVAADRIETAGLGQSIPDRGPLFRSEADRKKAASVEPVILDSSGASAPAH